MSDGLKKVGVFLNQSRKKTTHAAKNYSPIIPMVERGLDRLNSGIPFKMFFELPKTNNSITVDVVFHKRSDS